MIRVAPARIEVSGLRKRFGSTVAVDGLSFTAEPGTVTGFLGPNGAGKTTTLKALTGLVRPMAGHIHIAGHHINGTDSDALARIGICHIPEGRGIFPSLTVDDNLRVFTHAGTSWSEIQEAAYARFPRLGERRDQIAGTLSGGEQQMLALARGMATDPGVLLLDELSMGLAPLIVEDLYKSVADIVADGVTVIAVEQFAQLVVDVADTAAIMNTGRVTFQGPTHETVERLQSAYLGH